MRRDGCQETTEPGSGYPVADRSERHRPYCTFASSALRPLHGPVQGLCTGKPAVTTRSPASSGASFSHRWSAKPRLVVISVGLMRIPVSVSMRVRSFEVAQRVKAVFGERTVRIDGATQNQADLLGDQTPQPGGPLVRGQRRQLGTEFAVASAGFARWTGTASANWLRCAKRGQPRASDDRGIAGVGAVVTQQRLERVGALVGSDQRCRCFRPARWRDRSRPTLPRRSRWPAGPERAASG